MTPHTNPAFRFRPEISLSSEQMLALSRAGVDPTVAEINLNHAKLKFQKAHRCSTQRAEVTEIEYKRFLSLILWNARLDFPLVPTRVVDQMWHQHILDTEAYRLDTERVFGFFLDHNPYVGMWEHWTKDKFHDAFVKTVKLYERTFGERMLVPGFRVKSSVKSRV